MVKRLLQNKFFSATLWVYISFSFLNLGNYLYHLLMARMLQPRALLGELEGVISFFYILSVPVTTLSIIIIRFVSSYKGKNDENAIAGLYHYFFKNLFFIAIISSLILLIISPFLVRFLHLSSYSLIVLLVINFVIALYGFLARSVLQGLTNFFGYAISNILESVTKVVLSVVLVFIGFKTFGALLGLTIGGALGLIGAYWFIKKLNFKAGVRPDIKALYSYAVPVFFTTLALTSLYTVDVMLVRYFFPGNLSGDYGVLSVMGKVVFFAVAPVNLVLFPLVSEYHASGKKYHHYLMLSLLLTFLGVGSIIIIYFLIPEVMITLLPGETYIHVSPLLGLFGVFIGLYSLAALMANFYLSIHKTTPLYFVVIAAITQILGIILFHTSLLEVIIVSIVVCSVLLASLLLYYFLFKNKSFR